MEEPRELSIQKLSLSEKKPDCPNFVFVHNQRLYSLEAESIDINVSFNICTAFVKMQCVFNNTNDMTLDECLFLLPINGTVTNVAVTIGEERQIRTQIVPTDDLKAALDKSSEHEQAVEYEEYIPNFYRFPVSQVESGQQVRVTINYFEHLAWLEGRFWFDIPLQFHRGSIIRTAPLEEVLSIKCSINGFKDSLHEESILSTYDITKQKATKSGIYKLSFGRMLHPDSDLPTNDVEYDSIIGRDFHLSYAMNNKTITGGVLHNETHGGGEFVMFVAPPAEKRHISKVFGRSFFFLLDRSGSMNGEPYSEAVKCLEKALDALPERDFFACGVFDHEQKYFSRGELMPATIENVEGCKDWIRDYHPEKGGTDIKTPLLYGVQKMNTASQNLPFVVLITDGCVEDERDIIRKVREVNRNEVRILTLGIGRFCNWYFLKLLAKEGRGYSEVVVYQENIERKMGRLLKMCDFPVLVNVSSNLKKNVKLYPYPIPDLFFGQPLLITGTYSGKKPARWEISGHLPRGANNKVQKQMISLEEIPPYGIDVSKILIKNRLDLLTAEAWFDDSEDLKQEVVRLSMSQEVPSAYTTIVAIETGMGKRMPQNTQNAVSLVAGGAALAVGAAAFSFGSVTATFDNIGLGDVAGIGGGIDGGDGVCFGCCCFSEGCEGCDNDCLCCEVCEIICCPLN